MKATHKIYTVYGGSQTPAEVYTIARNGGFLLKDARKDGDDKSNCVMLYLYTLMFIGLSLLLGLEVVDIYFDMKRNEIEIESCYDCEDISNEVEYVNQKKTGVPIEHLDVEPMNINVVSAHQATMDPDNFVDMDYVCTTDELEFIYAVVEAEVTGTRYRWNGNDISEEEMLLAKVRVCQVFLNRVKDETKFPYITSLYEAMSEPNASSTVASGRYLQVEVTDLTRQAVEIAIDPDTEDLTNGALFFLANGAKKNRYGEYLFTDAVGHSFFK